MKRKISLLLAAILTLGSTAVGMAAITFSDINNVPWEGAKTYITKVSDLGLMVGEESENGSSIFRAKDKVTYCETAQLVYNLLKNEGEAKDSDSRVSKWESVMAGYKIPGWAYQAVSYVLENEIVSTTDISGYMKSKNVGNNSTREDVAVIFGKALVDQFGYKENLSLGFNDNGFISNNAKPYVGLLSELNILIGDDNKNFNPGNLINRAEMAVVTVKTYSVISGEELELPGSAANEIKGTVNFMTNQKITVDRNDGGSGVYVLSSNAVITLNGSKASVRDITNIIENGLTVSVKIEFANGAVSKVTAEGNEDTIKGYLTKINENNVTIKRNKGTTQVYDFDYDVEIRYEGERAKISEIQKALKNGIEIEVTAEYNKNLEITKLVANVSTLGGENAGAIKTLTEKKITLYLKDGSTQSYQLSEEVTATYEDKDLALYKLVNKFEDGIGLSATIFLNSSNEVSKIDATIDDNTKGVIVDLNETYITIMPKSGVEQKKLLEEDVIVKLNSGTNETLKYLMKIYEKNKTEVVISLNKKEEVIKIEVDFDEDDYDIVSGTVNKVESKSVKVGTKIVDMDASTTVTVNGEKSSVADLVLRFKSGETLFAKLVYGDNIAKSIDLQLENSEGRIVELLNGKIKISTEGGVMAYDVAKEDDLTIKIDGSKDTYSFIELNSKWSLQGINYDVVLTFEDGKVVKIVAKSV